MQARIGLLCLVAVAIAMLPEASIAAAVTLVCESQNPASGLPPWTFPLDVDAGRANNFRATVTEQTVTWWDSVVKSTYRIDRVSGVLTISDGLAYLCHRGERHF